MADFRKWIYAFAVVALLAGLTVPASAQTPPFTCSAQSGTVVPLVRSEGLTELVGDVVLYCTGGTPTVAGQQVPQVNLTVFLNTNVTSRITATVGTVGGTISYNEALLLVDEPNAPNSSRPILNCGAANTTETDATNNPAVCSIASTGNPAATYSGAAQHPNVFQGRLGVQQNPGQFNAVTFAGVPIDPPGTTTTRIFRITNVRANANAIGVSSTFTQSQIQMNIAINGPTTMSINNPQVIVAYVNRGLTTSVINKRLDYVQCNITNFPLTATTAAGTFGTSTTVGVANSVPAVRFTEGFNTAWKVKNVSFYDTTVGNAKYSVANGYQYNNTLNYPSPDFVQNVPGAAYNTESGFTFKTGQTVPSPNPLVGFGTAATAGGTRFAGGSVKDTGIANAGVADQGTRLSLSLSNIPNGATLWAPKVVSIKYQGSGAVSGVMVATSTDAAGAGAFTTFTNSGGYTQVTGLLVYEVLFADTNALEFTDVPLIISYTPNLSSNLPQPGLVTQAVGGFAPFYSTTAAGQPSSSLPIPRFVPGTAPLDILSISKCACNLLFPYVVSAAGFDTGIALANTSVDPGATYGFGAVPQDGKVTLWYYGVMANGGAVPGPQTTNKNVPKGTVLLYVASSGNSDFGLDGRAAGLVGYMITQSEFQYCHAVAYISALGAGPTSPGASEAYVALQLDSATPSRTIFQSEILGH